MNLYLLRLFFLTHETGPDFAGQVDADPDGKPDCSESEEE